MPFGVTQYGVSPDPRQPDFALTGFNFGQLPAWRWSSKTTEAEPPFQFLNVDYLWEADTFSPAFGLWLPVDKEPFPFKQQLQLQGTTDPQGGPPTFTSTWQVTLANFFGPPISFGEIKETFENAIGVRAFDMSGMGTGGPLFPNPLVFTPQKWNRELPV